MAITDLSDAKALKDEQDRRDSRMISTSSIPDDDHGSAIKRKPKS
jgi:hypothetical protein